jgi:SAM-dependent methyltransferase
VDSLVKTGGYLMVDDKFKHDLSWEEKARRNPLYAVMSANDIFAEKSSDPSAWTKEDLEIFYQKGRMLFDAFIRPVLLRADIKPEKAFVVEYGSGLGTILKAVKAAGYDCAGIDISSTMLGFSRQVVPEVTSLSCLDESGHCDVPTASADMVYSRAVIHHIKDLSRVRVAIEEMARILKPGGYLKMHFRTLSNLPLAAVPLTDKKWLLNFETRSIMAHFAKRAWLPISLPMIGIIKHTNWVGVPLSISKVKHFFNENNLDFLGLEKDVGGKPGFVWALAQKGS